MGTRVPVPVYRTQFQIPRVFLLLVMNDQLPNNSHKMNKRSLHAFMDYKPENSVRPTTFLFQVLSYKTQAGNAPVGLSVFMTLQSLWYIYHKVCTVNRETT